MSRGLAIGSKQSKHSTSTSGDFLRKYLIIHGWSMIEYYCTPPWPPPKNVYVWRWSLCPTSTGIRCDFQDMKSSYIFLESDIQLVMFGVALRAITLFQLLLRTGRNGFLADFRACRIWIHKMEIRGCSQTRCWSGSCEASRSCLTSQDTAHCQEINTARHQVIWVTGSCVAWPCLWWWLGSFRRSWCLLSWQDLVPWCFIIWWYILSMVIPGS